MFVVSDIIHSYIKLKSSYIYLLKINIKQLFKDIL